MSLNGSDLIAAASRAGSCSASAGAHSRSRATFTPFSPVRLWIWPAREREPRGCAGSLVRRARIAAGREVQGEGGAAADGNRLAQRGGERVDQAALDPARGDDEFAGLAPPSSVAVTVFTGVPAKRSRKCSLHRIAKPQLDGRSGRHDCTALGQHRRPRPIRAQLGPAPAAEGEDRRVGPGRDVPAGRTTKAARRRRSTPASDGAGETDARASPAASATRAAAARPSFRGKDAPGRAHAVSVPARAPRRAAPRDRMPGAAARAARAARHRRSRNCSSGSRA